MSSRKDAVRKGIVNFEALASTISVEREKEVLLKAAKRMTLVSKYS